jgi:long-subunit fatty acid transport protein
MIKKIIISACLLFSLVSFAQEGTASPYSFYGIGDVRFKGTVENRSMAGIAVEQDSIHINLQNPASFANLKLTSFAVGGSYITTELKTDTKSENARRTALDYLVVGLPLGKIGVGFGLIPYSSVGYKLESISDVAGGSNRRNNGTGGLNKAFLGVGYKVRPNFSIGADAHYNFGKIETNSFEFIDGVAAGTQELNTGILSGFNFNIGAMYQTKINKKLSFFSSLNYTIESTLRSQNTRNISIVSNAAVIDVLADQVETRDLRLPSKLSLGAGIGESRKWLLGAQVVMGSRVNSYNDLNNVSYEKSMKYSVGGYYIPNYNSFTSYFKKIVLRGGLKYDKTGLMVNSESINDMGFTLGAGFPISGVFSNVNLGFELGKRGTASSNLVEENYATLSIWFSLNDKWFVKRKFN